MSYTYLQDAGEESLAASFSDITLFAPLKSNPTAAACFCNGSGMACCHDSQSGMTCEPSTASLGGGGLMLSAVDSRVRTSQQPERAQDSPEPEAGCGPKCEGSLARWNPDLRLWKTRQCSLFGGLESFSENWPRWGLMRSGELWVHVTPVRHTNANEFGSWPTPTKTVVLPPKGVNPMKHWQKRRRDFETGKSAFNPGLKLEVAVGGVPHPLFVEWLMGWPLTWTELQPLEMDKFRLWLRSHGAC